MCNEECGLLPNQREQFVEIVGGGGTVARSDAIGGVDRGQETETFVVDKFPLLTLLDALNGEAELLLELVVGVVVEVAHAGVYANHGL